MLFEKPSLFQYKKFAERHDADLCNWTYRIWNPEMEVDMSKQLKSRKINSLVEDYCWPATKFEFVNEWSKIFSSSVLNDTQPRERLKISYI